MSLPDGLDAQAESSVATIVRTLHEAGFALGDIRPAATLGIAGLMRAAMEIEIEVTARRG